MIYRKKHIDAFREYIKDEDNKIIALVWKRGIGKSTFLEECEIFDIFWPKSDYEHIILRDDSTVDAKSLKKNLTFLIIDTETSLDISEIRTIIESYSSDLRVIFTTESDIDDEWVVSYRLPTIGLREYLEHEYGEIKIADILSWNTDISKLNSYRDIYLNHGGFPEHLVSGKNIMKDFEKKRAIMISELYEKEYDIFDTYLRTIAMNVGNLFKADQIAKLLDISRRKVNKYTEIILKHNLVVAIGPWVQDTVTETSRHVKLYFTDLGDMKAILGNVHAEGAMRQGALENMIYLELEKKLRDTHTIYFYRKKSGSEITFLAEDTENTLITPIIVTTRSTDAIPQVLKVFESEYSERIERYMICNDDKVSITTLEEHQLMILPHVGI